MYSTTSAGTAITARADVPCAVHDMVDDLHVDSIVGCVQNTHTTRIPLARSPPGINRSRQVAIPG